MSRRNVDVMVYSADQYGEIDGPLSKFIALLNDKLLSIPEEFRDRAKVSMEAYDDGYGCDCAPRAKFEIWYSRPQTDQEYAEERAQRLAEQAAEEAKLKAQYERLKAHFGYLLDT